MDKNSITGIILIALIFLVFSVFNRPSREEVEAARQRSDSLARIEAQSVEREPQSVLTESDQDTEIPSEDIADTNNQDYERYGAFASSVRGEDEQYVIENEEVKIILAARGGRPWAVELKNYTTWDSRPLMLFEGYDNEFGLNFFANNRAINTNDLYFTKVSENSANGVSTAVLRLNAGEDRYIEYVYTLHPGSFMVDFDINLVNMDQLFGVNASYVDLKWEIDVPGQEKGRDNENNYSTIHYKYLGDDVDKLSERSDNERSEIRTRLKWISFKQQFFSSVLIADDHFSSAIVQQEKLEDGSLIRNYMADIRIPLENTSVESLPFQFYFGPNHFNTLRGYSQDYYDANNYDIGLENMVPLGWGLFGWVNRFVVIPVFNFLEKSISNYGIIILLLTIFIKIVLFPLTYKSYLSTSKMRVLKPQIDEINAKIPKDKAMERQQATMALYKKAGVNPMGGCLPMLIQFPILIAMFRFFPTSFELRQESFLWATDLSTFDSILELPFNIPFYGDHVSLFTLLMTISTVIYTRMNSQMTAGSSQMPGMQTMMYLMPVMFLFIFNSYPAALSYYYFLTNIITFGQQAIIKRFVSDEEILRKLNENKKKPVKKSNFQKRLEDMAKQKGYKPSNKPNKKGIQKK